MKKYEYKVKTSWHFSFKRDTLEKKIGAELDGLNAELGPQGWELVSCSLAYGDVVVYTFKREVE